MSYLRHATNNTIAQAFSALFLLLVGVITARLLGPEGRGIYALFFTSIGLLSQCLYFGMTQSNVYFLNRKPRPFNQIFSSSIVLLIVIAGALALAFFALHRYIGNFFSTEDTLNISLLLWAGTIVMLADLLFMGIVLGRHYYNLYSLDLFVVASGVLVSSLAVVFFPENIELIIAVRVIAITAIMAIFGIILIKRTRPKYDFSWPVLKEQLHFGFKSYAVQLIGSFNFRIYLLFMAALSGNAAAGLFSVVMLFSEPIRLLPNALGPILLAHLSKEESLEDNSRMTARACRITLGLSLLSMLIYIPLIPYFLIFVFGADYTNIGLSAVIVALSAVIGILYQLISRFFTSLHLQTYILKAVIVGFITAIILSLILVPYYNVLGGAFAFAGSTMVTTILALHYFAKVSTASFYETLCPQSQDFVDCMALYKRLKKR